MHWEKSYAVTADANEDVQRTRAMQDIAFYLGSERFAVVNDELRKVIATTDVKQDELIHDLRLPLSFAGIQGYPVRAWVETLWKEVGRA